MYVCVSYVYVCVSPCRCEACFTRHRFTLVFTLKNHFEICRHKLPFLLINWDLNCCLLFFSAHWKFELLRILLWKLPVERTVDRTETVMQKCSLESFLILETVHFFDWKSKTGKLFFKLNIVQMHAVSLQSARERASDLRSQIFNACHMFV